MHQHEYPLLNIGHDNSNVISLPSRVRSAMPILYWTEIGFTYESANQSYVEQVSLSSLAILHDQ